MGSRKPARKSPHAGSKQDPDAREKAAASMVAPAPFHAPFQELARSLKQRPAPPPKPAAAPRPPAPQPPAPAPLTPVLSDQEVLAASLAGVRPLPPLTPRVRIRRKADLSHVEDRIAAARRQDVDAMSRGEGFDITFEDHYVRGRAAGVSFETLSRLEKGEFPICAHLDLHGLPLEDARKSVDDFLVSQQKRGHRCVLVVTGKGKNSLGGRGVLREQVPQWLARGPSSRRVLAFASARPCDGGLGALVVLMRAGSSSKNRIDVEHGGVGPAGI
ncbi:MAG: Smr/MutS family protein [Candidatus Binatia bacterium]